MPVCTISQFANYSYNLEKQLNLSVSKLINAHGVFNQMDENGL